MTSGTAYADHGIEADVPIAVTEHNLVAFIDGDDEQLMTKAVNAFYLAETIGQMATNGVTIANQWNLANGRGANGTDYGLIDAQTHQRSPAYYAMALWSRFGDELVEVEADAGLERARCLRRAERRRINPAARDQPVGDAFGATIAVEPAAVRSVVTADVVVRGVAALDERHLERLRDTEHRPHRARRGRAGDGRAVSSATTSRRTRSRSFAGIAAR